MDNRTVHFVGIGGIGMSALARHLLSSGYTVSGSDQTDSDIISQLRQVGARVSIGHHSDNVPYQCDLVVYSSAVVSDNVELTSARQRRISVILREQLLGQIFNSYRQRIAICGTHGKTTCTSMLDYVMRMVGIKHTSFIGGVPVDSHSNYSNGGNVVVAEACEYREGFLYLFPSIIVALNMEWDHPDYYKNIEHVCDSYRRFFGNMDRSGSIVMCGDTIASSIVLGHNNVTFGLGDTNQYIATNLNEVQGKYSYQVVHSGQVVTEVYLSVAGKHNVINSLAVIVACVVLGLDASDVASILATYQGIERRWMAVESTLCSVIEDYAHHPTEIEAVIATARQCCRGKVYVAFQPHTYSRTEALWRDFVVALSHADVVLMLPIYSARGGEIEGISSALLANSINKYTEGNAVYVDDFDLAYQFLVDNVNEQDMVLVLGAGDINNLSTLLQQHTNH